ncbi:dihydrodipicolinate synthase family protein [Amycolatopsis acidicola]|uniref:Dihydrodipicolinate synthase family protein n=1 Tax=Amycolatopsis acidicola TaxID=2596893 RepID=A0A5N0VEF7_9PSEU|nr:dihydrodipicolinate synthase family protein [Amycolatopsis acidicola]KAA9164018.1 dihydrodipicolinate synthase family protein [Amycolatopsis acidicola]
MTVVEARGTGAVGPRGVFTALVTPFDEDGRPDRAALERLVEAQVAAGVDGVVVCGSTGEFPSLTEVERMYALEVVARVARGRTKVTVQVGHTSTAVATALARHAASYEVDALLVAPPYYGPLDDDDLITYHRDVSAAAPGLPLLAYNYPDASGVSYTAEFIRRLRAAVPAVTQVKDSSGVPEELEAFAASGDIVTVCGQENLAPAAAGLGIADFILGAGNFAAPGLARIGKAARSGDHDEVAAVMTRLGPLFEAVGSVSYTAGVKAACEEIGLHAGPVRKPVKSLAPAVRRRIAQAVRETDSGLLTPAP